MFSTMTKHKRRNKIVSGFLILLAVLSVLALISVTYISGPHFDSFDTSELYVSYNGGGRSNEIEDRNNSLVFSSSSNGDYVEEPEDSLPLVSLEWKFEDDNMEPMLVKFNTLQECGRQFKPSKHKRELVLKYWELRSWLKKQRPAWRDDPPALFNFDDYDLWTSNEPDDRIIGQFVWAMQLTIQNYLTARDNTATNHGSAYNQSKRIFVGNLRWWPSWAISAQSKKQKQTTDCSDNLLAPHIEQFRPKCELVGQLPEDWNSAGIDAITTHMDDDPIPNFGVDPPYEIPWFKYSAEPPLVRRVHIDRPSQYINSYWSQSLIARKQAKWVYYDPEVRSRPQENDYAAGKTKMVAVFLPTCTTWNNRLGFVKLLQKFISVDVYGKCGKNAVRRACKSDSKCSALFEQQDYRFVLAFEKVNCRDYISRVLFNTGFQNNMIPIVMGAYPSDYRDAAPQNSFIHVEDFESPKELANYLQLLASNSTLYNKYFEWRGTGEFVPNQSFLCRLCSMLYYKEPPPATGNEIEWVSNAKIGQNHTSPICLSKNRWWWNKSMK